MAETVVGMTKQSLPSFQLLVLVIEFSPLGCAMWWVLHLQVQRVMELFQAHCRPSQTILRGAMPADTDGEKRQPCHPDLPITHCLQCTLYYIQSCFLTPLSTVFVLLPHLYYPGFILFLAMLKPLNSSGKMQNQRDLSNLDLSDLSNLTV